MTGKTTILGCGNALMGDDGVGVRVVELLQKAGLPPGVEAIDAGVGGLAILGWIENADKAIIVDAVQTGNAPPGTVYRFTDRDLPPPGMFMLSLHDLGLVEAIAVGRVVQAMPADIVIIGVEVGRVAEFTEELTPEVAGAVPEVLRLVRDELG